MIEKSIQRATGSHSTSIRPAHYSGERLVTLYQRRDSGASVYSPEEQESVKIAKLFGEIVSELEGFEAKYGMNSEDFYTGFQSGGIESEQIEFYKWRSAYNAYLHMQRRFGLSR
jgi:hypothetical protein